MSIKLSIITINLNNCEGLRKTIKSVILQTCNDYEYIVIDGASTDGSVDVIKQYEDKIAYWITEPDIGIYNAMNKGILKATGEYCLFLNSGDWLADNNVLSDFISRNFKEDIVSGNIFMWGGTNDCTLIKAATESSLTYEFFMDQIIYHQSTFIKRKLFSQFGLYNEEYKIVSDWEFFIKALIINNCSYINYDRNITYYIKYGISGQKEWMATHLQEREKVFNSFARIHKMYVHNMRKLQQMQMSIDEYKNLRNGSFCFIIKFLLWLKSFKKFH